MIGQTISHYKILEKLGEGGMGVVYKAQDTKLDRFVAVKFLPAQMSANDTVKARFKQEAKAAAALSHPNILSVYEIDERDGQLFFVMEYVDGMNLRQLVQAQKRIQPEEALTLIPKMCEALQYAHEEGVVHRDPPRPRAR